MELEQFYGRLVLDRSLEVASGWNPYYRKLESGLAERVSVEGREMIDLASNNYLGLAGDPRVKAASIAAVECYGTSLCGTPVATGSIDLYRLVEEQLASFVGLEDALLLPSGYQANTGLFAVIAGKEDLVVVDHYAHSSLVQGIRQAGCKIRPFLHNNLEYLEKVLNQSAGRYRQIFIVTESVFSTEGSIAPFKEIVELARRYEALPVVDDSHGIGVIGAGGHGVLEAAGVQDYPGIYTASLGKALANAGGVIAGKRGLLDYLRYYCPHLVYSTALAPAALGGIAQVLTLIEEEFQDIRERLWRYKEQLATALTGAGFMIAPSASAINSILAGEAVETLRLARRFYEHGVLTTPFVPPSVPANEGRLRLIAGAHLPEDTMEKVIQIIAKVG